MSRLMLDAEMTQLTRVGTVVGTPAYMAPEQWVDALTAGSRADLYSMGILAFQALTGRAPFEAKSLRQIAWAHARDQLPPLPDTLPSALQAVLAKATAKEPSERYATATELASALHSASGLIEEARALPQLDDTVR